MVDVLGRRRVLDGRGKRRLVVALRVSSCSLRGRIDVGGKGRADRCCGGDMQDPFLLVDQVYILPLAFTAAIRGQPAISSSMSRSCCFD